MSECIDEISKKEETSRKCPLQNMQGEEEDHVLTVEEETEVDDDNA